MTQSARPRASARKDDVIQIRTSVETKAILNRAAALRGQKLSEFMLDSSRQQAEEAILDQRLFFLDAKTHDKFLAMLDAAQTPSKQQRKLMNRKPAWER
jgi:uncharacterized protein (DUF1778 family)